MAIRTALIGPSVIGALSAIDEICNEAPYMRELPRLDVSGLLFSTIFQAGVDLFETYDIGEAAGLGTSFMLKRTSLYPKDKYNDICRLIDGMFSSCMPDDYERNTEYLPVWILKGFLTDLLFCLDRNTVMISSKVPGIKDMEPLLPPDIFFPIRNLCEQISSESVAVAMPKASISRSSTRRFAEIIRSDCFSVYVENQAQLDHQRFSVTDAVRHIADSSLVLQYNYPTLLRAQNVAFSLVPATAKLLSSVFQHFPKDLAEWLTRRTQDWIEGERRIVIYETMPFLMQLFRNRAIQCFPEAAERLSLQPPLETG